MLKKIKLLLIEDSEDDAFLLIRNLTQNGYEIDYTRVDNLQELLKQLEFSWDLIISDYSMPGFDGISALEVFKKKNIDIPFIIVSGTIGEEIAVQAMKTGAQDYIMKDNLSKLAPTIDRELKDAKIRKERNQVNLDLMRSEQKYRSIFEQFIDLYFSLDAECKFDTISPSIKSLLHFDEYDLIGEQFSSIFYNKKDYQKFYNLLQARGRLENYEIRIINKFDDTLDASINCKIIKNNSDVYIEGTIRDISDWKKTQQELLIAKELAEKSDVLKGEFLAQVSHEIRTPVNVILNFAELLKSSLSENEDEDYNSCFKGITNAGKRLIRTVDLILNMSELQTGTYEYSPKNIDVFEDVLKPVYYEYTRVSKNKELDIKLSKSVKSPNLTIDEYSMKQVVSNLIDNAIKFTSEGLVSIKLKYDENMHLMFEISDTGIGISEEYLPHLFDAFSQEEQGYTRRYDGNGLGLTLVKKFCDLNKATIKVESTKGTGSKFKVIFNQ